MTDETDPPLYREAMAELQQIVDRLRGANDVDVDDLVRDVARAKELINFCSAKIRRADAEIKSIVGDLQPRDGELPASP